MRMGTGTYSPNLWSFLALVLFILFLLYGCATTTYEGQCSQGYGQEVMAP